MKTTLLLISFCLTAHIAKCQSTLTRIYFVKNGAKTLTPLEIFTNLSPNNSIMVRNNGYTLVETDADSIGFVQRPVYLDPEYPSGAYKNQKPVFITLERGKSYFFKMGPVVYSNHLDVEEMTERAFWLYLGVNNLNQKVRTYFLSGSGGLSKQQ